MIGLVEFCEKAGFQNVLSERCHEYLVEKETIGVQTQNRWVCCSASCECVLQTGSHWIMPPKAR